MANVINYIRATLHASGWGVTLRGIRTFYPVPRLPPVTTAGLVRSGSVAVIGPGLRRNTLANPCSCRVSHLTHPEAFFIATAVRVLHSKRRVLRAPVLKGMDAADCCIASPLQWHA